MNDCCFVCGEEHKAGTQPLGPDYEPMCPRCVAQDADAVRRLVLGVHQREGGPDVPEAVIVRIAAQTQADMLADLRNGVI